MLYFISPVISLGIILLIFFAIRFFLRPQKHSGRTSRNWHTLTVLSRKDALSQWLLILGSMALIDAIYVINRNFGSPITWQTIMLFAVLIFAAAGFLTRAVWLASLGIISFLLWWCAKTVEWAGSSQITVLFTGLMWLAILLYALGFIQEKFLPWKRFATAYTCIGIILATALLFIFSTKSGFSILESITGGPMLFDDWQNVISIFIVGALTVIALACGWSDKRISGKEIIACAVLFQLFGSLLLLSDVQLLDGNELSSAGIGWALVFNVALFLEILGIIFSGYLKKEMWLVNMGAIFLVLFVAIKYFDWFFSFLDKSVFFVGSGILLFAVGWTMERTRRYLAGAIRDASSEN